MIISEFYYGKKEIFRIYHKGRLIWEKNIVRAIGQLTTTLCGIALPTIKSTENVLMYSHNIINGMAMLENMSTDILAYADIVDIENGTFEEYEPIIVIMHTDCGLIVNAIPHSAETKHGFSSTIGQLICVAHPSSFGIVFTRGSTSCKLIGAAFSRPVETIHSSGEVRWQIIGATIPIVEDMQRIYMSANSEIVNISIPHIQEIEQINTKTTIELVSLVSPMALLNCNVVFMNDATKLYETKILEGYSCEDPVEANIIAVPTKSETVSHTYKHSGWSRIENGVAEDLGNITDDTIFYATFDAFIRYYTANFYLDNNLVSTQEVAYGEMAEIPNITKEGYIVEWMPNNLIIYGDTDFYGVWTRDYIITEQTMSFASDTQYNVYASEMSTIKPMENGKAYIVVWDGKEYLCNMHEMEYDVDNQYIPKIVISNGIGNVTVIKTWLGYDITSKESDTGEPFLIDYYNGSIYIYTQETDSSHIISIYAV